MRRWGGRALCLEQDKLEVTLREMLAAGAALLDQLLANMQPPNEWIDGIRPYNSLWAVGQQFSLRSLVLLNDACLVETIISTFALLYPSYCYRIISNAGGIFIT